MSAFSELPTASVFFASAGAVIVVLYWSCCWPALPAENTDRKPVFWNEKSSRL